MKKITSPSVVAAQEEQNFWLENDPSSLTENIDVVDQFSNLKPSTKIITLRVPELLLSNLKLIANKRDIPYQSLLKHFLQEKVNDELQTPFMALRKKAVKKSAMVAAAFLMTMAIGYSYVVQPIKAQGVSMDPSYPTNAYYLLDKISYTIGTPNRNDVIVFASPSQHNSLFFKRVIGLPGEKVSIHDGNVYINDEKLYEPYAQGLTTAQNFPAEAAEVTVPGNSYYVLGDNRQASNDSRQFGFVSREGIIGKVSACYWNCQ